MTHVNLTETASEKITRLMLWADIGIEAFEGRTIVLAGDTRWLDVAARLRLPEAHPGVIVYVEPDADQAFEVMERYPGVEVVRGTLEEVAPTYLPKCVGLYAHLENEFGEDILLGILRLQQHLPDRCMASFSCRKKVSASLAERWTKAQDATEINASKFLNAPADFIARICEVEEKTQGIKNPLTGLTHGSPEYTTVIEEVRQKRADEIFEVFKGREWLDVAQVILGSARLRVVARVHVAMFYRDSLEERIALQTVAIRPIQRLTEGKMARLLQQQQQRHSGGLTRDFTTITDVKTYAEEHKWAGKYSEALMLLPEGTICAGKAATG